MPTSGDIVNSITETWRDIPGWTGLYQVSDLGRVRSLPRRVSGRHGSTSYKARILKTGVRGKRAYPSVTLSRLPRREYWYVHDLVLLAFVGPKPDGMQALYRDDDSFNNVRENLRYGTPLENAADLDRNGLRNPARGEQQGAAKLTDDIVRWIRANAHTMSQRDMGALFSVSHNTIGRVQRREAWEHIE